MKIKVIIDLKNVKKEDLQEIARAEEIVGGWKGFIQSELEIHGLDNLMFDYDIDYKIIKIEEIKK